MVEATDAISASRWQKKHTIKVDQCKMQVVTNDHRRALNVQATDCSLNKDFSFCAAIDKLNEASISQ